LFISFTTLENQLNLSVVVLAEGELKVSGLSYKLRCQQSSSTNENEDQGLTMNLVQPSVAAAAGGDDDVACAVGWQEFRIRGPRLNVKKANAPVYGVDKRFLFRVLAPRPALEVCDWQRHEVLPFTVLWSELIL
jgi:hypothetical protein